MRKTVLLIAAVMIIVGAFFFVSSVTLVNCAGSLIVAGGCEEWLRGVVPMFWLVGALFFGTALTILVFGLKPSVRRTAANGLSETSIRITMCMQLQSEAAA